MFKNTFKLAIIVLALTFISLNFIGCSEDAAAIRELTIEKASVESVMWFNKQPIEDPNDDDRYQAEQILKSKGTISKKYKLSASGSIDSEKYLKKHPADAVTISSSNSDGRVDVRVYSDNPTPDSEFFQ